MHISYLPWNRGASPNIWSFIDDTPKGVTIHRLEKGLDTGKIIAQKELKFNEDIETLQSSYMILNKEIVNLFKETWKTMISGDVVLKNQVGDGSYHKTKDLEKILNGKKIDYSITISEFKKFISRCVNNIDNDR